MKNPSNRLITIIVIMFVLACNLPGTPPHQPSFSDRVETIVAATMQSPLINILTDTPTNIPIITLTETFASIPTENPTNTSIPTDTPTNTFTPTMAALVVVDVITLTPFPPCTDPVCSVPYDPGIVIAYQEMIHCNAAAAECRSTFSPANPNSWSFSTSDDVCVLWVEEGDREPDKELSIYISHNAQAPISKIVPSVGNRACRILNMPMAPGNYETKLILNNIESKMLWSIR